MRCFFTISTKYFHRYTRLAPLWWQSGGGNHHQIGATAQAQQHTNMSMRPHNGIGGNEEVGSGGEREKGEDTIREVVYTGILRPGLTGLVVLRTVV